MDFGGPVGAFSLIFFLPILVLLLNIQCGKDSCDLLHLPSIPVQLSDYFDFTSLAIYVGWFSFQAFLALIPTGQVVKGTVLKNGSQLLYRCNGFQAAVISLIGILLLIGAGVPVYMVYRKFLSIAFSAIIFSWLLAIFLYIKSLGAQKKDLSHGGQSGYFFYDFFIGRELNPRLGSLDLKFFCELRPGLIGWVVLDVAMLHEAFVSSGTLPVPLLLVVVFHSLYVLDALWFEEAILTTMDIIEEGFGFMLAFGDLAWVPFLYCLQARYILEHSVNLPSYAWILITCLNIAGYSIFRLSNSQKNLFRQNPNHPKVAHLETIPTATGKKLLVSGWWGMCRHPNYLGDLMMALSWSLMCGLTNLLPFFYPIYFTILLVHREIRDYANCHKKYGDAWKNYCKKVPYRIFPYIY